MYEMEDCLRGLGAREEEAKFVLDGVEGEEGVSSARRKLSGRGPVVVVMNSSRVQIVTAYDIPISC